MLTKRFVKTPVRGPTSAEPTELGIGSTGPRVGPGGIDRLGPSAP